MMKNIKSKKGNFLVIGASGTIGSEVVRKLSIHANKIGLHYCNNETAINKLRTSLDESFDGSITDFQSNLDTEESCADLIDRVYNEFDTLSGIALCAGRVPWKDWQQLNLNDWQGALFEHCIVPFSLAKLVSIRMQDQGCGHIVYLSSIASKYGGSPRSLHYASAKGALEVAMHGLAKNVAKSGVNVNGVRSGFVHSPQHQVDRTIEEISERINKIPMGRAGKPDEVAATVNFLLSPDANFITGEIITTSGGD